MFHTRGAALLVVVLCSALNGYCQPAVVGPPRPDAPFLPSATNQIQPTVTTEMGDRGGTFFGRAPDPARTRRYYIAAEPELWDFTPLGRDPICGKPLPPPVLVNRRVAKLRYAQYTDETFTARVLSTPRLGVMGPVLRGVVGEFLAVTFLNRTDRPVSMHAHGAKYDKDSEGSYYEPKPGLGAAVGLGARFTYVWHLDEEAGPLPGEPSSKGWLYHSHVHADEEMNLGLVGFLVATDPARARTDGTPADVDREMASLFMIFDESGLGAAEREAAEYGALPPGGLPRKTWAQVQELTEQGARAAINGYIFGNLPGLEMNEGERVRWYLFGLGSEEDFHTAHWHGLRVVEEGGRRTDVVDLLPATMKVADMRADNPGTWLFHCHVTDHMLEGMFANVVVHPKGSAGVSRAPEEAFFGLRKAGHSVQFRRATAELDLAPGAAQPCELRLEGTVTVFQAFSVFTQPMRIQIGERAVTFKPDRRGVASTEGGTLRVKNVNQFGVVYGGLMDFEITLSGTGWLEALQQLGLPKTAERGPRRALTVPLSLHLGQTQHSTSVELLWEVK